VKMDDFEVPLLC